jgi:DNA-binding NtrC family response regulator
VSDGEAPRVLVVEDDDVNRDAVVRALTKIGYLVTGFAEPGPALEHLRSNRDVSLVITDLVLPVVDGFGVLSAAREIDPDVGVLMITGHASIESAVDAMKRGADDYLTKPVDLFELRKRASAIVEKRLLSRRVVELESRLGEKFGGLVGASRSMQVLFRQMELVSPTRSNVLIVGESGTGKELVANALHENSPRRAARFLPINCAAIPAEILESELFGHEKGAFTGATARKIGKFELAEKGTLFLDEIGELPLEMQVKLLRVLEQRELMRVGGSETIRIDIRLVAATNADLESAVEQGRFRSDLYYRLKVVTLRIPPLRERRDDIPRLANHFLSQFARENDRERMRLTAEAMRALVEARWEGNVRELRNLIESLVVLTPHDDIALEDLPDEYRRGTREGAPEPAPGEPPAAPRSAGGPPSARTMEEIERDAILETLQRTRGNRTQAAEVLGIGLRTLQRKLKDYVSRGLLPEEGPEP